MEMKQHGNHSLSPFLFPSVPFFLTLPTVLIDPSPTAVGLWIKLTLLPAAFLSVIGGGEDGYPSFLVSM